LPADESNWYQALPGDGNLRFRRQGVATIAVCVFAAVAGGEKRPIDIVHSRLTVRVGKTGFFSAASHNHEILAPIIRGEVEASKPSSIWFEVNPTAMSVVDPNTSESDRLDVQKRMLGPDVLDAERFREIRFASDSVENIGEARWRVRGMLTLHGLTKPIVLETTLENGHYRGTATVLQTNFGITPIKIAGGTIKVKDEVQIEFDIMLAGQ
jgi:hypothetical protein